jgi:hypothetical protein
MGEGMAQQPRSTTKITVTAAPPHPPIATQWGPPSPAKGRGTISVSHDLNHYPSVSPLSRIIPSGIGLKPLSLGEYAHSHLT